LGSASNWGYRTWVTLHHDGTDVYFYLRDGGREDVLTTVRAETGRWYCIELKRSTTGDSILYIDGTEVARIPFSFYDTDRLMVGGSNALNKVAVFDCIVVADMPIGPEFSVTVSPTSASLVVGETQTFTATVTGGTPPYTIEWVDAPTGAVIGTGDTFTFTATERGTFQILARATDDTGAVTESDIVTITVYGMFTLTINSTPIDGITFTIDGEEATTPYSKALVEGTHVINMPAQVTLDTDTYIFVRWSDGPTENMRTIDLAEDTTLTAEYELYVPPPQHQLTVDSTPIKNVKFIIERVA